MSVALAGSCFWSKATDPVVVSNWFPPHTLFTVSRSKKHAPGVTVAVGLLDVVGVGVTVCASAPAATV
jgi:hypothetical protein